MVPWRSAKLAENCQYGANTSRSIRIAGIAGDSHKAVLRQRTGSPRLCSAAGEPAMGNVMMNVSRITQRQQEIDIEQEGGQGLSSRSWLTSSMVTTRPSPRVGKSGTP